jgi:hypothetical protein
MNDDRILQSLGDLARREGEADRARFDERWDRLAAGTLSPEEDAELRALAATSPELREAYEAFRPLGPDVQARIVEKVAELVPAPVPQPLPFYRRAAARRIEVWLGSAAAIAAALFLVIRIWIPGAPLPPYQVDPVLGVQSQRGEPTATSGLPVFVPGSLLTVSARPSKPVEGPVEARGFVRPLSGGGAVVPLDPQPPFKIENGAVRLRATLGQEIRLTSGDWRLWIVVGRPGKIPTASALAEELRAGRTGRADWQALLADLRVDDRAPP